MSASLDRLSFYVLDALADDWESLEQIVPHVGRFIGVGDASHIACVVVELLSKGLLVEMKHTSLKPHMIVETPTEYWFSMTSKGRALWEAESRNLDSGDQQTT